MQFKTLALSLFVAVAAAESVQELISQIPSCAKPCLDSASTSIGCSTTDNKCQCSNINNLIQEAAGCVSTSCSANDLGETTQLSTRICAAVALEAGGDAVSSVISGASAAVTSVVGEVTGTGTDSTPTATATPGAGHRSVAGLGFAAVVAALAL
ncbi:hypothetical protein AAE478_006530 [Parahypoxylon ruwenzoriense]